jgi:hypothetical protein
VIQLLLPRLPLDGRDRRRRAAWPLTEFADHGKSSPLAADLYGDLLDFEAPPPPTLCARMFRADGAGIAALAATYLSEHYGAPLMLMACCWALAQFRQRRAAHCNPASFRFQDLLRWGIVLLGPADHAVADRGPRITGWRCRRDHRAGDADRTDRLRAACGWSHGSACSRAAP